MALRLGTKVLVSCEKVNSSPLAVANKSIGRYQYPALHLDNGQSHYQLGAVAWQKDRHQPLQQQHRFCGAARARAAGLEPGGRDGAPGGRLAVPVGRAQNRSHRRDGPLVLK